MCGIAAAIGWQGAEAAVARLLEGLAHRGEVTDPILAPRLDTALGTRRLKIVDGAHGTQPRASADGRILVVMNGEIYNHLELRAELEAAGTAFETQSDTEVLANALAVWGPSALQRLRGMYAFIALDVGTGAFLAARDPFGQKPLYLIQRDTGFLFASEIAPLLAAVPEGDVLLLPPAHALTRRALTPFYVLPAPAVRAPASDPKVLDALLGAAVAATVPGDLPAALFFSGGVDSTLVAHYARRVRRDLPGYFVGAEGSPDYPYAACYAERTGLDLRLTPFCADGESAFEDIDAVIAAMEGFEPSLVRPGLCYQALARKVRADGFKVVLTGEGADELFAGYRPLELTYQAGDALGEPVRTQCLELLNRGALQRSDRTTMREGVEARAPFLDLAVADHALSLGAAALLRPFGDDVQGKAPLRALFALYPELGSTGVQDRAKSPLNEGAGLDVSQADSPLRRRVEALVSDREFADGRRRFAGYALASKEEYYYLTRLAKVLDVERVPHLKGRLRIAAPDIARASEYAAYIA
jgi:asparagine synthase (glutamine-hydrolysing)